MQNDKQKAKIYNILALIFLAVFVASVIWMIVLYAEGRFNGGGGDVLALFIPIQILIGAIALVFRAKAVEFLSPRTEPTEDEKDVAGFLKYSASLSLVVY